jgi:hypothetical protein
VCGPKVALIIESLLFFLGKNFPSFFLCWIGHPFGQSINRSLVALLRDVGRLELRTVVNVGARSLDLGRPLRNRDILFVLLLMREEGLGSLYLLGEGLALVLLLAKLLVLRPLLPSE